MWEWERRGGRWQASPQTASPLHDSQFHQVSRHAPFSLSDWGWGNDCSIINDSYIIYMYIPPLYYKTAVCRDPHTQVSFPLKSQSTLGNCWGWLGYKHSISLGIGLTIFFDITEWSREAKLKAQIRINKIFSLWNDVEKWFPFVSQWKNSRLVITEKNELQFVHKLYQRWRNTKTEKTRKRCHPCELSKHSPGVPPHWEMWGSSNTETKYYVTRTHAQCSVLCHY